MSCLVTGPRGSTAWTHEASRVPRKTVSSALPGDGPRWTGARIWVAGQPLTALLGSSFPHANRHLTPRWLIRHAHCVWAHLALATAQKILPFAQDFMFTYHPLFVSCACCNKLPQTERLKRIQLYYPMVLDGMLVHIVLSQGKIYQSYWHKNLMTPSVFLVLSFCKR